MKKWLSLSEKALDLYLELFKQALSLPLTQSKEYDAMAARAIRYRVIGFYCQMRAIRS